MFVSVSMYVRVSAFASGGQRRWIFLELELRMVVNDLKDVLGTNT